MINNEKAIADLCLVQLKRILGHVAQTNLQVAKRPGIDFELHIGTHPLIQLQVEVKARIATRNQALHAIFQLQHQRKAKEDAIVFTEWVPETVAEEFRKAGVFFVDQQGNAFIQKPPHVFIDIRGKRPAQQMKAEPGRLIEPAGLKVIHYLLTHPQAAGQQYRTIAEEAHVALRTAYVVVQELERMQWLRQAKNGRTIDNEKAMIDLFVRGYELKLRPACLVGRYRHPRKNPLDILEDFKQRLEDMPRQWALTGGMAAKMLTHYLEPDNLTLFVDDQAKTRLDKEPMLRDDANGNVTLLRMFAPHVIGHTNIVQPPIATPLLVYAELIQDGRPREAETAKMILENYLEPEAKVGTRIKANRP